MTSRGTKMCCDHHQEPKPEAAKPKPAQAPGGGGGATAMEWILGRPGPKETNHTSHAPLDTASKSLPSSRIPVRHKRRWVADLMSNSRPLKIPRKRVPAPAVSPPAVKKVGARGEGGGLATRCGEMRGLGVGAGATGNIECVCVCLRL